MKLIKEHIELIKSYAKLLENVRQSVIEKINKKLEYTKYECGEGCEGCCYGSSNSDIWHFEYLEYLIILVELQENKILYDKFIKNMKEVFIYKDNLIDINPDYDDNLPCPFLGEDKKCMIQHIKPINCWVYYRKKCDRKFKEASNLSFFVKLNFRIENNLLIELNDEIRKENSLLKYSSYEEKHILRSLISYYFHEIFETELKEAD